MCTVRLMRAPDNDELLTDNYPRREASLSFMIALLSYQDILSYPDPPPCKRLDNVISIHK